MRLYKVLLNRMLATKVSIVSLISHEKVEYYSTGMDEIRGRIKSDEMNIIECRIKSDGNRQRRAPANMRERCKMINQSKTLFATNLKTVLVF